jgi:hypothetical protein
MSNITDQAESLRIQAIGLLQTERQLIDQKLAALGADGMETSGKKNRACSLCGVNGHNAKTCTKKGGDEAPPIPS